jgi:hypothetical protein
VVLPQPEGPMKETNSPSVTVKSTWDRAKTGPSAVSKVKPKSFAAMTVAATKLSLFLLIRFRQGYRLLTI